MYSHELQAAEILKKPDLLRNAELSWDESGLPHSVQYGDIYFSNSDPLQESTHVFLDANKLESRWQQLQEKQFVIAELGFGCGLNFLNTCRLWLANAPAEATLHYLSCELHPVLLADLKRIHGLWPELQRFSCALLEQYPEHGRGQHTLSITLGKHRIVLHLLYGDASQMFDEIYQPFGIRVDAWFLDGFAPRCNPAMWQSGLLATIEQLSKTGTTLTTYSVAGAFRRDLQEQGFTCQKIPGYGNKREMLLAHFDSALKEPRPSNTPWFCLPEQNNNNKQAIVVGAGLAGCATASALANTGWQVTVVERNAMPASGGSGNPWGILHCKLGQQMSRETVFYRLAYQYAVRHYNKLLPWLQCGMLQLGGSEAECARQLAIIQSGEYHDSIVRAVDEKEASQLSGMELSSPGLFFPGSGMLSPPQICQQYLKSENIRTLFHQDALKLHRENQQWHLDLPNGVVEKADVVVICNSSDAHHFSQSAHYPLISNQGQISQYHTDQESQIPKTVVCEQGYILPTQNGMHTIGGSYNIRPDEVSNSASNLACLARISPSLSQHYEKCKPAFIRTAIRCTSPDFIPLAGPVENFSVLSKTFKESQLGRKPEIVTKNPDNFFPGLFINVAHGSHGLTTTPILANYISAIVNQEVLPLQNTTMNVVHPARFLIRSLKRQAG